ncbi:MAG: hypothetical protein ACQEXV_22575 [Bacillota bacterium]
MQPSQVRAAIRALTKKTDLLFTKEELQRVAYGIDKETDETYHWFAELDGQYTELVYHASRKFVEVLHRKLSWK